MADGRQEGRNVLLSRCEKGGSMNSANARILTVVMGAAGLCFCLDARLPAATPVDAAQSPHFEPGQEYHIRTDSAAIGTRSFNLFVPRDYTSNRAWPVVFHYTGRGDRYNPSLCRPARSNICDRGAIVAGMAYIDRAYREMTTAQYRAYMERELTGILAARKLIAQHLRVDDERLFISGTSAGGWLAAHLLEHRAQVWAGAMIFVAGRHSSASLLTNDASVRAFRGLPVFFGSALPGLSHGENHPWAVLGAALYEQRGAIVTFQIYDSDKWFVHCPVLRDWVGAFIFTGKNDTLAQKQAKWQKLVREAQMPIDSRQTIRAQIAKQLGLRPDQLNDTDLRSVEELSLVGQRIADLSYLANLPNLESLDISFTYVKSVEPLLACQHLHRLDLSDTHVKDLVPLKGLPHLQTLRLWNL